MDTFLQKVEVSNKKSLQTCTCFRCKIKKQAGCAGCRRRTFTAEATPIGKIHPFRKNAVTFEPVMRFGCPPRFIISLKIVTKSILWIKAPSSTIWAWWHSKDIFTNHHWTEVFLGQPLGSPGSAKDVNTLHRFSDPLYPGLNKFNFEHVQKLI